MKYLNAIKYLLAIATIVLVFVEWKFAIGTFVISILIHVFPYGPHTLLNTLTGLLIIAGVAFLFFDWRIGVALIIGGFLVSKFHVWGNKKNFEYYSQQARKEENDKNEL